MGKLIAELDDRLRAFIAAQPMFFVASACAAGRVNCSPKGMDALRVLDARTIAWVDVTGSGNETAAHVMNDGRLTLMWCSFGPQPLILRVYGRGRVAQRDEAGFAALAARLPSLPGMRQILVCAMESGQTSCGFGVPRMELIGERDDLSAWCARKGEEGLAAYRATKNRRSIDGFETGLRG